MIQKTGDPMTLELCQIMTAWRIVAWRPYQQSNWQRMSRQPMKPIFHVEWIHVLKVSKIIVYRLVHGNEPISEDCPPPAVSTCWSAATGLLRKKRLDSNLIQVKVTSCFIHVFWLSIMEKWKVISWLTCNDRFKWCKLACKCRRA